MHATIRNLLCSSLALVLLPAISTEAQSPSPNVPPQITSAHTIFVSNAGGSTYFDIFTGGADRAYSQLLSALEKWNRYQIVQSPSQADLIFEISAIAPPSASPGNDTPGGYDPQLVLRIRDPQTNAILWTTTANVVAGGLQKSRDRGFDKSVTVLVDHVRQLTGEQLTSSEQAAVYSNARPHLTASRVVMISSFAAVAIMAVVGFHIAHEHEHQTLTPPPLPACTTPFCPI